ncbi:molybdate ABC transporter permease subunit [Halalkalibacterium ligniniphilum]|uniref:molybdate ABC transporter permease subunit n=1 Tax=Halalkalibacterium ligniniphilum TaxID=1134413 RepID=UPI0003494E84|nr:molybdate ABC transporter permease subunit [Halalkalibacterium ligniniphilum]
MAQSFWTPILLSLQVVIVASTLAFFLALIAASFMKKRSFKGKIFVETALMLPLVLPPTVIGFGLLVLMGRNSWIGRAFEWLFQQPLVFSYWAAVIAATVVAFPLVFQMIKTGFEEVDTDLEDAARSMGGSELQVFFYVTLPLAKQALLTGFVLGFARALGEFGATLMFAGSIPGRTQTVPIAIYLAVETGNQTLAYYWVISIIVFSFILLSFVQRAKK